MTKNINEWNSANISQFELSKLIYTSGFLTNTNLTATTKLVLMALVQHYNANNAEMFPSQKFLAKQLGISEKSVERSIANLKSEEYIYYVTKKVNRYRFTAKFFEQIKMSVVNRQNVGNDTRQNVGQTNNMEKINKKDYFLNFEDEIFDETSRTNETGAFAPQKPINLNGFRNNKSYQNSNIVSVSPAVHFKNFTGRWEQNQQERAKQDIERQRFLEKRNLQASSKASINNDNEENNLWISPLDYDRDDAKKWIQSLPLQLKNSKFAQKLIEKYKFLEDEIYSEKQKIKIAQMSDIESHSSNLQQENFI